MPYGLQRLAGRLFAVGEKRPQLVDKITRIGELAIDACKTDKSNFVKVSQMVHHQRAQAAAINFRFKR